MIGIAAALAADAVPAVPLPVSLPAVSGLNGKIDLAIGGANPGYDLFGFSNDFDAAFRAQGAFSVPLGHSFGLQADGAFASIQGSTFAHAAGHLFGRNPASGLIGAYASYSVWDTVNRGRVAFEGEAYLGNIALETITGVEFGDVPNSFFTITDAAVYPSDDLRLSIGFRHNGAGSALAAGLEYQFASGPSAAWSAFVDGEIGTNDYQRIFGGIRLYLGADKSLIRRHREDDPRVKSDEWSLTGCTHAPGAIAADGLLVDSELPADVPCNLQEEDVP
jgi:hypothetical protein